MHPIIHLPEKFYDLLKQNELWEENHINQCRLLEFYEFSKNSYLQLWPLNEKYHEDAMNLRLASEEIFGAHSINIHWKCSIDHMLELIQTHFMSFASLIQALAQDTNIEVYNEKYSSTSNGIDCYKKKLTKETIFLYGNQYS